MLYSLILIRKRKNTKKSQSHTRRALDELSATHLGQPPHELHYSLQNIRSKFPSKFPKLKHPHADTCKQMFDYTQKTKTHIHTHTPHRKHTYPQHNMKPHTQRPHNTYTLNAWRDIRLDA